MYVNTVNEHYSISSSKHQLKYSGNEGLFARMLFNRKLFTDNLSGPVQMNFFTLNLELEGTNT